VVLDEVEKAAEVRATRVELNDDYGVCIQLRGTSADVKQAVSAAEATAREMGARLVPLAIDRPTAEVDRSQALEKEYQPLLEQDAVWVIDWNKVMSEKIEAIGLIETQGFAAVIAATDAATKAADVDYLAKEKLGGGYITIVFTGKVAAVEAAVQAGKAAIGDLGKLIAAKVIANPSESVRRLLTS